MYIQPDKQANSNLPVTLRISLYLAYNVSHAQFFYDYRQGCSVVRSSSMQMTWTIQDYHRLQNVLIDGRVQGKQIFIGQAVLPV